LLGQFRRRSIPKSPWWIWYLYADEPDLAKRAVKFKQERGRLPSITSPDPWEKKMAEGVAYLARMKQEAANG
jgi:hypothetical protein